MSDNRTNATTLEGVNAYVYDNRNWLTSAGYPDGRTQTFTYDAVGNRLRLGEHEGATGDTTFYSYDAGNRLLSSYSSAETNSYAYDGAGRLTNQVVNGHSRNYGYSFRSQMTSLTDTNGFTFSYDFDGDGNRIKQSGSGCLTARYVYDGPNVVLDLNASNQVVHAYVHGLGIDQPIERIAFANGSPLSTLASRLVYHTDALGSVVAMTDGSQQTAKSYSYEAFGRIRSETGTLVLNRYTFTGREALGDSLDLYYYRWRVMDPNVGRFTSEDPLGFVDGPNLHLYVGNNPLLMVDPDGLSAAYRCCLRQAQQEHAECIDRAGTSLGRCLDRAEGFCRFICQLRFGSLRSRAFTLCLGACKASYEAVCHDQYARSLNRCNSDLDARLRECERYR